jgi:LPS sulfotransferase NodH
MAGELEQKRVPFSDFVAREFGPDTRADFVLPIARLGVMLCFVSRSGSNYLAECLASSGDFPRAREHFLEANLAHHPEALSGLQAVFRSIVLEHCLEGIFAAKLGYRHLETFSELGYFERAFAQTRFVLLKRRDALAQAISLDVAMQTRTWQPHAGPPNPAEPRYSRKRIALKMEGIARKYEQFEIFFRERGIEPFRVIYEDLAGNARGALSGIDDFLGIPMRCDRGAPRSPDPVADAVKEEWKRRFVSETP